MADRQSTCKDHSQPRQELGLLAGTPGLAALGVMIFHVRIFLWTGWSNIRSHPEQFSFFDRAAAWLSLPAPMLGECVLLFFVISGFCIHYPMAGKTTKLELKAYAIRRIIRIYPPYFAAVCLSLLAVLYFEWTNPAQEPWVANLLLIQNYLPSVNSQISSNCSLWSIATEVEFYLAYPLLLLVWRRCGPFKSMLIFGMISLTAVGLYLQGIQGMVFSAFTFYILWWSGAFLAELHATNCLPKAPPITLLGGITLLVIGTIAQHQGDNLVMAQRFLFGGFFVLVVWWLLTNKFFYASEDSLLTKSLIHLGNISFSLYLVHYPLLQVCGIAWEKQFGSKPSNFFVPMAFCGLAIVAANIFYLFIEKPSHLLARKLLTRNQNIIK